MLESMFISSYFKIKANSTKLELEFGLSLAIFDTRKNC